MTCPPPLPSIPVVWHPDTGTTMDDAFAPQIREGMAGPAARLDAPARDTVLDYVRRARGFGPAGYCPAVLAARLGTRLDASGATSLAGYLRRLQEDPAELDALVEALTVKVSAFFRDPLLFELLAEEILPEMLARKAAAGDRSLRVWSAGCATGEEPYSVAILLQDLLRREASPPTVTILATDVDAAALQRARGALYGEAAVANVRHGLLAAAFEPQDGGWRVADPIARAVTFAVHDLLDPRTAAPAESVFGSFDLVLCRNVLIYFETAWQEAACERLYRSLVDGGVLALGRTESLPGPWAGRFRGVPGSRSLHRKAARPRRDAEDES